MPINPNMMPCKIRISTASWPAESPYLHDKNCARNVLSCQALKYLILKCFYIIRETGKVESDNYCHYFRPIWHSRLIGRCIALLKRHILDHKPEGSIMMVALERVVYPLAMVSQLELQGMGIQIVLLGEIRLIIEPYVVIDEGDGHNEGDVPLAIIIDDLQQLLLGIG
jgi:hypothetical protein